MKSLALTEQKARAFFRAGHIVWTVWGHVHTDRFTTPYTYRLEVYTRSQILKGKKSHRYDTFGPSLNGSWGFYFTKQKHAEAFAQEIREGKHPEIVSNMQERDDAFDLLDEELGICDRGLGVYADVSESLEHDYQFEEN